jgi:MinD-like ATPase involved in chromosome partitioning or flagellar assembly
MSEVLSEVEHLRELLLSALTPYDATPELRIQRSSLGWLRVLIRSAAFKDRGPDAREALINGALARRGWSLGNYPILDYELLAPGEVATQRLLADPPLWSQILQQPRPAGDAPQPQDGRAGAGASPLVVTFYSFKGGVGRSTALALTARLLAEAGRRVLMVDFDLEAPGLTVMLPPPPGEEPRRGVLDYISQRWSLDEVPSIDDFIQPVSFEDEDGRLTSLWRVGGKSANLALVPAGLYDEGYIHRLADFDVEKYYRHGENPVHGLLEALKTSRSKPDVILIDARTGFASSGAVALLDLADLGILCFAPSEQSYRGLSWVVRAARLRQEERGRPDLRFVLSPIPPVDREKKQEWLRRADQELADLWGLPGDIAVEELRHAVDYTPLVPLTEGVLRLEEPARRSYQPIADWIDASLPNPGPAVHMDNRDRILHELRFELPRTWEIPPDRLLDNFFVTPEDIGALLDAQTLILVGPPGSGKSFLYRALTERPRETLARFPRLGVSSASPIETESVPPAKGRGALFLGVSSASSIERWILDVVRETDAPQKWEAHALWLLFRNDPGWWLPSKLQQATGFSQTVAQEPWFQGPEGLARWLKVVGQQAPGLLEESLLSRGQRISRWAWQFILYDEIDDLPLPQLERLLSLWIRLDERQDGLRAKFFLRPGTFMRLPQSLRTRQQSYSLRWREPELWQVVLREAVASSKAFARYVPESLLLDLKNGSAKDATAALPRLREALQPLWGHRMGPMIRDYTHRWVLRRMADGQESCFPRSVFSLLQHAITAQRRRGRHVDGQVIGPESLREALPLASRDRVAQLREEEPSLRDALASLSGATSPLSEEDLLARVQTLELRDLLIASGVLRAERMGRQATRYAVAELYLAGLCVTRRNQRQGVSQ